MATASLYARNKFHAYGVYVCILSWGLIWGVEA